MNVKDVMNSDVVSCKPDDEISSAAQLLKEHDISGLPVVEEGKVVGIVTEADVLKLLEVPEHGGLWLPSPFLKVDATLVMRSMRRLKQGMMSGKIETLYDVLS